MSAEHRCPFCGSAPAHFDSKGGEVMDGRRYFYERPALGMDAQAKIAQQVAAGAYQRAFRQGCPDIKSRMQRDAARASLSARVRMGVECGH